MLKSSVHQRGLMETGMEEFDREMSQTRLGEIKERLAAQPPIRAIARGNHDKSPVAHYIDVLRSDQVELVREIERVREARTGEWNIEEKAG
jgi:hypothetical protein